VIEQLMIFSLGFLLAGLLALLFLPAVWRRALRLSASRLERRLPLSLAEIAAERDRLRAEFATEHRRIEQSAEALADSRARDRAEIGRQATRAAELALALDGRQKRVAELEADLARLRREADESAGIAAATEKELHDALALTHRRFDQLAETGRRLRAAADLAEERRVLIASLETRLESLEIRLEETGRELAVARDVAVDKTSIADLAEQERKTMAKSLAAVTRRRETAQKTIDDLRIRLKEQEKIAREAQRARTRLAAEAAAQARSLEVLRENPGQAGSRSGGKRQDARRLANQQRALEAERDLLAGALEVARSEAESLQERLARAQAPDPEGDAELRRAISELGADVLRLTRALAQQPHDRQPPAIASFDGLKEPARESVA
jgi:DNA repair exonuclease SbcCD ATPase subunit